MLNLLTKEEKTTTTKQKNRVKEHKKSLNKINNNYNETRNNKILK